MLLNYEKISLTFLPYLQLFLLATSDRMHQVIYFH
jgi:hypothetical protein